MENLSNIGVIKELLARHGFTFSKGLGQNFIVNSSVCPKMAEQSGAAEGVGVIEIGPGIGVLTCELARRASKVVCIEIDSRLLPILDETLNGFDNVKIVNQDVLKVDLHRLINEEFAGLDVVVCANLPYYITSPILMYLLENDLPVRSITVMVQKEAAQRLCAQPGTREAGAISLAVRFYAVPKVLFQVSRGSFMPAPDVDSTVIRLDVLEKPAVEVPDKKMFFEVVKGAFSQRRKTIVNCLNAYFGTSKAEIAALLEGCGVPATARAEELSLAQFGKIAEALYGLGKKGERAFLEQE